MTTQTPNKTNSVVVLAHVAATHPVTIVGSSIAAVTKRSVTIWMYHGFTEAAANTNPGKFKVQTRPDPGAGSVNEHWATATEYVVKDGTPDDEALTATEAAGVKSIACALTAGFAAEDLLYILDASVLLDSEWAEVQEVITNTSIELIDGLTTGKDSADTMFNRASIFICPLDLNANESYRVIWSHEGATGANGHVKALAITHDSDDSS